jgi:DNA-dependent RNA polymerase auxiliary subunit epsilon
VKLQIFLIFILLSGLSRAQLTHKSINTLNNKPNEPTVAIDPLNLNHIVAASNTSNRYESFDGALSWKESVFTSKYGFYGDPVLHYTAEGEMYIAHLSKTTGKSYGAWFDRIVVDRHYPDVSNFSVGYNNDKMQDKPWLSSDDYSEDYKGNVYVTWTEFDKYNSSDPLDRSRIRFSKLSSGSSTFSEAVTLSELTGDCLDGDNTMEGATSAVGTNGEIYVAWSGFNKIWFDASFDGGQTWSKDKIIADQHLGWEMDMPNIFRANGMPFVTCSPKTNVIYITWADEKDGNADVWLIYSEDRGSTWSNRIKLNLDQTSSHQYFPNIEIDEETEDVYVAFYDQRHSDKNLFYDVYLSKFNRNNPDELSNFRLTPQSIALPGKSFFYGDYLDIDIVESMLAVVYPTFVLPNSSTIDIAYGALTEVGKLEGLFQPITSNVLRRKDTSVLYINTQSECLIKGKIKSKKPWKYKTIKFTKEVNSDGLNYDYKIVEFSNSDYKKVRFKARKKSVGLRYVEKFKLLQ